MKRKLLAATALGLFSAIISRGSILAAMLLLAHKLSMRDFGVFSVAYITATSLGLFIAAGLSQSAGALIPRVAESDFRGRAARMRAYQWLAIVLCFLSGSALCLIMHLATRSTSGGPLIVASAIVLVSVGLTQSFQGVLYSIGHHRDAAYSTVIGSTVALICLLLLRNRLTPTLCLLTIGAGGLVTCVMNLVALSRHGTASVGFRDMWVELPRIRKSLYPLLATASLGSPVHSLCIAMLATAANGIKEVALFSASFQFYTIVTFVPSVVANIALPFFSGAAEPNGKVSASNNDLIFRYTMLSVVAVATVICGATFILSGHLLSWMLPDRFAGATNTIRILTLAAGLSSVSVLFQQKLNGSHLFWLNLCLALVYSTAYVAFAYLTIKLGMGSTGLALSILLAFAILLPCQIVFHKKFSFGTQKTLAEEVRS